MYHYVYRVIDPVTREFYIGVRSSDLPPETDSYKGSMKTWACDKSDIYKTILATFPDRISAEYHESQTIYENIRHPLNRNFHVPMIDNFKDAAILKTFLREKRLIFERPKRKRKLGVKKKPRSKYANEPWSVYAKRYKAKKANPKNKTKVIGGIYNNGITQIIVEHNGTIPEGFVFGRLKRS